MGTVAYTAFLPEVLPFVDGCPSIVAINAIRNACIDFCQETMVWQQVVQPMDVTAGVGDYAIGVPANTQLGTVRSLWFGSTKLEPKSHEQLAALFPGTPWTSVTGAPRFFTQIVPGEVRLVPYPSESQTGVLSGEVSVAPTRSSTTTLDELFDRYAEEIGAGARARLFNMRGQPYYNPAEAERNRILFEAAKGGASARVNKGKSRASARVQLRKHY